MSPNYPDKYADSSSGGSHQCHWFIHVKPRHKILLYFEEFEVEGKPNGTYEYETCLLYTSDAADE